MVSITEINPNSLFVHLRVRSEAKENGVLTVPGWYNCAYTHAHAPIDFDAKAILSAKQAAENADDPFLFKVDDTEIIVGDNLVIRLKDELHPEVRSFVCMDEDGEGILVIYSLMGGFRVKEGSSLRKVPFCWINIRMSPQSLSAFTRGDL